MQECEWHLGARKKSCRWGQNQESKWQHSDYTSPASFPSHLRLLHWIMSIKQGSSVLIPCHPHPYGICLFFLASYPYHFPFPFDRLPQSIDFADFPSLSFPRAWTSIWLHFFTSVFILPFAKTTLSHSLRILLSPPTECSLLSSFFISIRLTISLLLPLF